MDRRTNAPGQTTETDQVLDDLVAEISERLHAGEPVELEEYGRAYPEHAEELRRILPALQALANLGNLSPSDAASEGASPEDHRPLRGILGDYRIVREIGRGGMGVVYEAEQISLGRPVALKILPFAAALDPRHLQRFKNEAMAAASLDHPNIVSVHSVGCQRAVHFYAMQYIEGQTIAQLISELRQLSGFDSGNERQSVASRLTCDLTSGRLIPAVRKPSGNQKTPQPAAPLAETKAQPQAQISTEGATRSFEFHRSVVHLGIQAAEALEHAHGTGVVHRDVKPSNLMVDSRGHLWITDFGLAMVESNPNLTMTGDILGTLRYMSPEQALAKRVVIDHRTDVYSLGVTLYELLTLRPAYSGGDRQELLRQIAFEEPQLPRRLNKTIPTDLETIVLKAMAKNPAERYATAQDLAEDMRRFLDDKPIHARRPTCVQRLRKWSRRHRPIVWSVAAAAAIVLLVVAVGAAMIAAGQRDSRVAAERAKDQETTLRREAEDLGKEVTGLLASSYIDRAQALCEQGEIGRGMIWFAHSLRIAPDRATDLRMAIRSNLAAWARQLYRLRLLAKHPDTVRAVAFSPDGSNFLTGCSDGTIRLWDRATGELIVERHRHQSEVIFAVFSPDGSLVATGSEDGTARVWNALTLEPIGQAFAHKSRVRAAAFSRDGSRLLTGTGGPEGCVRLWDLSSAEPLRELSRVEGQNVFDVRAVAFTAAGPRAVITIAEGIHELWDVDRSEVVGPAARIKNTWAVTISPDGSRLATAGSDGIIQVWEGATGELAFPPIMHGGAIHALAFSPDGAQIVSGGYTRAALLWDATMGEPIGAPLRQRSTVRAVAFSPDGTHIVTRNEDGVVGLWDVAPSEPPGQSVEHQDRVLAAAFRYDGLHVLTQRDGLAQLRSAVTGKAVGKPLGHERGTGNMAFSPDGSQLLIRSNWGGGLWDLATGQRLGLRIPGSLHAMAFSPDGSRILTGSQNRTACLWDAVTMERIGEPLRHRRTVGAVAFSPDGSRILTGCWDGTTRQWDAATLQPIGKPLTHESEVKSVAYSPDGTRILTGLADGTVRLWDVGTLNPIGPPMRHQNIVCGMAFSPDGSRLATCSLDQMARLWDTATLKPIGPPLRHEAWWPKVSFSPDGSQVLVAGKRGTTRVWEMPPGPVEGDVPRVDLWTQVISGLELDSSGGISVLDAPAWQQRYRRLQELGGPPAPSRLPPPVPKGETDFSRTMDLALRGRDHAEQGRWEQADADFTEAVKQSHDSPTLRQQIAFWREKFKQTQAEPDKPLQQRLGPQYFPKGQLTYLDLQSKANGKLTESSDGRMHLAELPRGEQTFGGVRFRIANALIKPADPAHSDKVEGIPVNRKFANLYVLHGTSFTKRPTTGMTIGQYIVHYEDETVQDVPIVHGVNVHNTLNMNPSKAAAGEIVTWTGEDPFTRGNRLMRCLCLMKWENPQPEKKVVSIDYVSTKPGVARPFCVAMTVEEAAGSE